MDELKSDIKEIKAHVTELVKQGAIHNTILKEHERRSLMLEERFVPVERHVSLMDKVTKIIGSIGVALIIEHLIRRLL